MGWASSATNWLPEALTIRLSGLRFSLGWLPASF